MASAPPDPSELHKVTIVLDGSRLKGKAAARAKAYYRYMERIRKLAKTHGATIETKALHVKQRVITARKAALKKVLRKAKKK